MANEKLTQLPPLSEASGNTLLYVVDVSDPTDDPSGSSKQIQRDDLLKNITGLTANTISVNTIGDPLDCVDDIYLANLHGCVTGVTLHDNIIPFSSDTIDLGSPINRFRDINTLSGTSSYWTSTITVNTPQVDLGLDTLSNSRIINADNSVIQGDTLSGGTY